MRRFGNGNDFGCHFGRYLHRHVLCNLVIKLSVKLSRSEIERRARKAARFGMRDQIFRAVKRISVFVLKQALYHGTRLVLALNDLAHLIIGCARLERAEGALQLNVIIRVCIDRGNLDINERL